MSAPARTDTTAANRWVARGGAVLALAAIWVLAQARSASAAVLSAADGGSQTPPSLSWIDLADSRGISVWSYELSLDRGGITSPDKFFWSAIVDSCWGIYRAGVTLALWFLDWVLSFEWVQIVAAPLLSTGDAMQRAVDTIGVVPVLLTITAAVAVVWMAKGRYAAGIWELGMALVIASLALGVFADPVRMVAGPDGLIMRTHETALELSAVLAGQDPSETSVEQLRRDQTGRLVDAFVRQPTQMINFGQVLDGGACESTYNEVIEAGPHGAQSDIRDAVGGCEDAYGEYASNPSAAMALGSIVFMPASLVVLAMMVLMAGSVVAAGVYAMYQSVKAIVTLVTGLLPGGGRSSLFLTIAEVVMSLLIIVFTSLFLGVFMLVIQALFEGDASAGGTARTFVIVDVILVVGTVIYMRQRKQIQQAAARLAQWMSTRPGGAPATRMPARASMGSIAGQALGQASMLAAATRRRGRGVGVGGPVYNVDARRQAAFFAGAASSTGRSEDIGEVGVRSPASPYRAMAVSALGARPAMARIESRSRGVAGTALQLGASAAVASSTGGASVLVTAARAGKVADTTRRAVVAARLARAAAGTGPTAPSSIVLPAPRREQSARPAPQAPPSRSSRWAAASARVAGALRRAAPAASSGAPQTLTTASATRPGAARARTTWAVRRRRPAQVTSGGKELVVVPRAGQTAAAEAAAMAAHSRRAVVSGRLARAAAGRTPTTPNAAGGQGPIVLPASGARRGSTSPAPVRAGRR